MKLILLGILKGIGMVLLALLLLLLLLMLVVLLSPLRYRLAGEKKAELGGSFGVSWLFGAVKVDGGYTPAGSLKLRVKVLWFTLIGGEPKEKKEKKPKKKKVPKKEDLKPDLQAAEKSTPPQAEEPVKPAPAASPKAEEKKEKPPEQPKVKQQRMEQKQPKTVRRVKLSEVEEKPPIEDMEIQPEWDDAFFTGEEAREETKGKIPPIVKELWSIQEKKEIFRALKKLLKRLMKGILPGDLFLKATIGTGDPTTTGYVLAFAGVLTAKFGNDIQIKGDFTKATAEDIEVRVKGKIVLGKLLWAVLAFALTKPVRKAILKMIRFLKQKD